MWSCPCSTALTCDTPTPTHVCAGRRCPHSHRYTCALCACVRLWESGVTHNSSCRGLLALTVHGTSCLVLLVLCSCCMYCDIRCFVLVAVFLTWLPCMCHGMIPTHTDAAQVSCLPLHAGSPGVTLAHSTGQRGQECFSRCCIPCLDRLLLASLNVFVCCA